MKVFVSSHQFYKSIYQGNVIWAFRLFTPRGSQIQICKLHLQPHNAEH